MILVSSLDLGKMGIFKSINSFNDFKNLTYQDIIYYAITTAISLYGLYLFISAIVFAAKEKNRK